MSEYDWNRTVTVEALIASGTAKKSHAYNLAKTIPHATIAGHPVYKSTEVLAFIQARVIAREDDASR
jgi:hypothetical protein